VNRSGASDDLLTAQELAARLGRSVGWVWDARRRHGLIPVRFGRSVLFYWPAVAAWILEHAEGDWPPNVVEALLGSNSPQNAKTLSGANGPTPADTGVDKPTRANAFGSSK
jgi:hypothetical protein